MLFSVANTYGGLTMKDRQRWGLTSGLSQEKYRNMGFQHKKHVIEAEQWYLATRNGSSSLKDASENQLQRSWMMGDST